jgi:hypothetical protein
LDIYIGIYIARHVVRERVPILMKSTLFWQIVVLNVLFAGISIALPGSDEEPLQTIPRDLAGFVALSFPVLLDAVNTTPTETRVVF